MTTFDLQTINSLLNRPSTPSDQPVAIPTQSKAKLSTDDIAINEDDNEGSYAEL